MTDHDDDEHIATVNLPILWGGSVNLYASGRVEISTTEGGAELDAHDIAALADLLTWAQGIRNGTIRP